MTHAEILTTYRRAAHLVPSSCPGELAEVASHADRVLDPEHPGAPRERVVIVWACAACGARVSGSEGVILNVWWPIPATSPDVAGSGRPRR